MPIPQDAWSVLTRDPQGDRSCESNRKSLGLLLGVGLGVFARVE